MAHKNRFGPHAMRAADRPFAVATERDAPGVAQGDRKLHARWFGPLQFCRFGHGLAVEKDFKRIDALGAQGGVVSGVHSKGLEHAGRQQKRVFGASAPAWKNSP